MKVLYKNAKIYDKSSAHHGQRVDVLVSTQGIEKIGDSIHVDGKVRMVESSNLCLSMSFVDIGTQMGEPGYEHRETMSTLANAAKMGGYSTIAPFANTLPIVQSKGEVNFLKDLGRKYELDVLPIAAMSHNLEGKDMNEYIDLWKSGAIAFSDGLKPVQNANLLLLALEYIKAFDGLLIVYPMDKNLAADGQIHEGKMSTLLGMKGIPSLAEYIAIKRDLDILKYADGKLCFYGVSTQQGLKEIKEAKKERPNLKATCSYLHLLKTDQDLDTFDSNLKVMPPLRSKTDKQSLIKALKEDTLDAICSNHVPLDEECKKLEFPYANFGASGIESCFSALCTYAAADLGLDVIVDKLSIGPRKILGLALDTIAEGAKANITVFDPDLTWSFQHSASKSINNPYLGQTLKGKVLEVVG